MRWPSTFLLKGHAVTVALSIALISSAAAQEVIVDWEAAAARAALTEQSFYGTNGARDTSVLPEGYTAPVIDPQAHIKEADRKVA